ncbi:MAG: hypothetical protein ACREDT_03040 [Methylocella sp.]
MITMFRSRDAAWAAAKELSQLIPAHDYEAWPDRGYWVLVMRYRNDDGHIRFKFVEPEDRLSKTCNIQEKTLGRERRQILQPDNFSAELKPFASRKAEPPASRKAEPRRRVCVEAMQRETNSSGSWPVQPPCL